MAKHLSKGEKRDVERLIQKAISPEWKLLTQQHVSNQPVDATSDAKGSDIFAGITQGVGDNNRIGDAIRVRRIEIVYVVDAPSVPQFRGHIPCLALVYRSQNSGTTHLADIPDAYDQSVMATPLMYYGPTFTKRDLWERGIFIRKLRRFKIRGCQRMAPRVWNPETGTFPSPGAIGQNGTYLGLTATTTPPGGAGSFNGNPGNFVISFLEHQPNNEIGQSRVQFKHVITYGGNGLRVTFADGTGAITDSNRVFAMLGCGVPSGTATGGGAVPANCPHFSRYARVWFTDE